MSFFRTKIMHISNKKLGKTEESKFQKRVPYVSNQVSCPPPQKKLQLYYCRDSKRVQQSKYDKWGVTSETSPIKTGQGIKQQQLQHRKWKLVYCWRMHQWLAKEKPLIISQISCLVYNPKQTDKWFSQRLVINN